MASQGRYDDILELYRLHSRESNPSVRRSIMATINAIKNESRLVTSMRESLIKAHREGDTEEIKSIHDYIKNKSRYGQ